MNMEKQKLEDFINRLERIEELADDLDVTAYHLRKDMEKELKQRSKKWITIANVKYLNQTLMGFAGNVKRKLK